MIQISTLALPLTFMSFIKGFYLQNLAL